MDFDCRSISGGSKDCDPVYLDQPTSALHVVSPVKAHFKMNHSSDCLTVDILSKPGSLRLVSRSSIAITYAQLDATATINCDQS